MFKKSYADNFFFLKLYELDEDEYSPFYNYHLAYFVKENTSEEKEFFSYIHELTNTRINYYKQQTPFGSRYVINKESLRKSNQFLKFLHSVDHWNHHKSLEVLLAEKEEQIQNLKSHIENLEAQIKELNQYESAEKISIVEGKLATVIDLFRQIQELTLPDERKLFRSQTQSPWYKMLSKYFLHWEKEIPINTARNYFPANKNTKLIKGSEVADEDKIFKITAKKK
jgi:molybdopterin converting factor small subunit